MSDWKDIQFLIPKHTDQEIHQAVLQAVRESELSLQTSSFQIAASGAVIVCDQRDPETDLHLTDVLVKHDKLLSRVNAFERSLL